MKVYWAACFATLLTATAYADEAGWRGSYQLESSGKYLEAIALLDPVPVNGTEAEFKNLRRGWLYYQSGRFDESIREYRYAIERNSRSIDARMGVLLPLQALSRWREVEQGAQALLVMAPHNQVALLRLLCALEAQKNWQAMEKTALIMVADYPADAQAYLYLARAYAWLNQRAQAEAAHKALLIRSPGQLEALAFLGYK